MFLTLLPYLTVVANLALVLVVLLGLGQRVNQLRARGVKHEKAMETENARMSAEIAELKDRILELEKAGPAIASDPAPVLAPMVTGNGVNNTLRSKVLKMHRLG